MKKGKKFATMSEVLLFPLCVCCRAVILHDGGYTHTSKVAAVHSYSRAISVSRRKTPITGCC